MLFGFLGALELEANGSKMNNLETQRQTVSKGPLCLSVDSSEASLVEQGIRF